MSLAKVVVAFVALREVRALRFARGVPNCSYSWSALHGDEEPNMQAFTALSETFMDVVASNDALDVTVTPWKEIVLWMDDILTDVMGCVDETHPACSSEDYCLCEGAPGPRMCCPFNEVSGMEPNSIGPSSFGPDSLGPNSLQPNSLDPNSYSPSAEGDPHITTITGEKFDLWKMGWSTFMQIPQYPTSTKDVELLISGNVRKYWGTDACAPAFLDEVKISGNWVGGRTVQIFSGSLESQKNFTVSIDGGPRQRIENAEHTVFHEDDDLSVVGAVKSDDPEHWRPDAVVVVSTEGTTVQVSQHTEGRYEGSMAMLDVSVTELDQVSDTVGGWLGVDGASMAGEAPPECAARRPALVLSHQEQQSTSKASFMSGRQARKLQAHRRKRAEVCLS